MTSITTQKEQIIKLFKEIVINYINNNNYTTINYHAISSLVHELKINEDEYKNIINEITSNLVTKKHKIYATEFENIINLFSQKLDNYKKETINQDNDQIAYFHIDGNKSYLINYDNIELKWYLSLIDTTTLELIKEIYSNNYPMFINYITNDFDSKKATE